MIYVLCCYLSISCPLDYVKGYTLSGEPRGTPFHSVVIHGFHVTCTYCGTGSLVINQSIIILSNISLHILTTSTMLLPTMLVVITMVTVVKLQKLGDKLSRWAI